MLSTKLDIGSNSKLDAFTKNAVSIKVLTFCHKLRERRESYKHNKLKQKLEEGCLK